MELNLRTVLVILGSIIMLAILIDGFRRMRRARQEALKIDVQDDFKFPEDTFASELPNGGARIIDSDKQHNEDFDGSEAFNQQLDDLPSLSALADINDQHAEIIANDDHNIKDESSTPASTNSQFVSDDFQANDFRAKPTEQNEDHLDETISTTDSPVSESQQSDTANIETHISHQTQPLNLDEHVPLLMDVEELGEEAPVTDNISHEALEVAELTAKTSEAFDAEKNTDSKDFSINTKQLAEDVHVDNRNADNSTVEVDGKIEPLTDDGLDGNNLVEDSLVVDSLVVDSSDVNSASTNNSAGLSHTEPLDNGTAQVQEDELDDGRQQAADMLTQAAYAPVKKPGPNAEVLADRSAASLVLITHVVPHDDEGFCGEDILYLVNNCDLRHGEKGIFHRFEQENGEGRVQFSMANSFNPGTFDPETLLHERIHGVSLFMSLPGPEKAMDAFEAMSEMASVIARNLGGEVHDETHSIMALQTIEHNRQQVRDFVRKQKLASKS